MNNFTVVADTREQQVLEFPPSKYIAGTVRNKLDTGDYSIQGLETVLCIERKGSLIEMYRNVTESRFERELTRMAAYKYRFLILEFSLSEVLGIPYSLGVKKEVYSKMKLSPNYIMRRIAEIQVQGIQTVFAENREIATDVITNIMKCVYECETRTL